MKRTPLTRKVPPQRTEGLRPRSPRTERRYRVRRPLVAKVLHEEPDCQLRLPGCTGRSTCVDEKVSRARWPAGLLVRANLQGSCWPCNQTKEDEPLLALAAGVAGNSWEVPR